MTSDNVRNDGRRRLGDLVVERLVGMAGAWLRVFPDMRAALADEIEDICAHADPSQPGARLRYGWTYTGSREREMSRSLGITVHCIAPAFGDGDEFEVGTWRVRDLCDDRGRPIDTRGTLAWLSITYALGPVPDDARALTQPPRAVERPSGPLSAWPITTIRLAMIALKSERMCCAPFPEPGTAPTIEHEQAHAIADAAFGARTERATYVLLRDELRRRSEAA